MKIQIALFAAALLAGCSQQPSNADGNKTASAGDMPMSSAEHMQMEDSPMPMQPEAAPMATTASAMGTVKSIDTASGKITIAHDPVASLKWPAMTMGFKATPDQLASVQAGQKVEFEFESKGMDATIRRISPTK